MTGTRKKTHMRDREMSEKMKSLKIKMEVQEITFNYFARPQPRDLNFYVMMMMAIQKILLSVVSKFVVDVWDGLDACEISRPEILSQSAPGEGYLLICHQCSIHLDDATAAIVRQNSHHTPAYWWRGDRVMKPISRYRDV